MKREVWVIGGGLAGSEAAWQLAQAGERVRLFEMRPVVNTPAHKTSCLGELVCSNSLKADYLENAAGLLKWMRLMNYQSRGSNAGTCGRRFGSGPGRIRPYRH